MFRLKSIVTAVMNPMVMFVQLMNLSSPYVFWECCSHTRPPAGRPAFFFAHHVVWEELCGCSRLVHFVYISSFWKYAGRLMIFIAKDEMKTYWKHNKSSTAIMLERCFRNVYDSFQGWLPWERKCMYTNCLLLKKHQNNCCTIVNKYFNAK